MTYSGKVLSAMMTKAHRKVPRAVAPTMTLRTPKRALASLGTNALPIPHDQRRRRQTIMAVLRPNRSEMSPQVMEPNSIPPITKELNNPRK